MFVCLSERLFMLVKILIFFLLMVEFCFKLLCDPLISARNYEANCYETEIQSTAVRALPMKSLLDFPSRFSIVPRVIRRLQSFQIYWYICQLAFLCRYESSASRIFGCERHVFGEQGPDYGCIFFLRSCK